MTNVIRLHLCTEGYWRLFLEIPLLDLSRLTLRPVKWLRYLGWCIYGRPGWLSTTPGGLEVAEDAELSADYYYVSTSSPRFIDINAIDDRTSDSSQHNRRLTTFREDVVDRDVACIVTEAPIGDCMACHILPHSRGDDYMSCVSALRADQELPVDEIGDIRNGVLLYTGLHRPFGDGEIAFLLTPNLYLLPEDIPTNTPMAGPPPPDIPRLTLQQIIPQIGPNLVIAPHNRDARLSAAATRPSAYLLHFFYACAILKQWGQSSHPYLLAKDVQNAYYDRESPYVSDDDDDDEDSRVVTGWPTSSSTGLPNFGGSKSLSDVMDDLLSLHLLPTSNKPSMKDTDRGMVLSWLRDTKLELMT
ncbi:hypothetical protein B0H12DRAFT_1147778 [Mycena haematopus]|nr:hypothetical protein B0H12DRAFT_1147778 [Mycena haematopus]